MSRLDRRLAALEARIAGAKHAAKPTLPARIVIAWMLSTPGTDAHVEKLRKAEGYDVDATKAARLRASASRAMVKLARTLGADDVANAMEQV